MKLSKGTLVTTVGIVAVVTGGMAMAATGSVPGALRSDDQAMPKPPLPVTTPALPAKPELPAPNPAVPGKPALPDAPKLPARAEHPKLPELPELPKGTCEAKSVRFVVSGGFTGSFAAPHGLHYTYSKFGRFSFHGQSLCKATHTWSGPAGQEMTVREFQMPEGVKPPELAEAQRLPEGLPLAAGGVNSLKNPVGEGGVGNDGALWFERPGVALYISGSEATSPVVIHDFAEVLSQKIKTT